MRPSADGYDKTIDIPFSSFTLFCRTAELLRCSASSKSYREASHRLASAELNAHLCQVQAAKLLGYGLAHCSWRVYVWEVVDGAAAEGYEWQ
jgi:hypothetical protein